MVKVVPFQHQPTHLAPQLYCPASCFWSAPFTRGNITTTRSRLHLSWTDSRRSNKDRTISNHLWCQDPNLSAIHFWSFKPLISHRLQNISRKASAIKASLALTTAFETLSLLLLPFILSFPSHPQLWPAATWDPSQPSDSRRSWGCPGFSHPRGGPLSIMRPLATTVRLLPLLLLAVLLLLGPAEPRRADARKSRGGGRVRGRGRAGVVRRQTQECKEYMEAGEKYLDCQDRQLTTVMQDWPKDIHHLLLARNRIQVCTPVYEGTSCPDYNSSWSWVTWE